MRGTVRVRFYRGLMFIAAEELDSYYSNLRTINGITFTSRQVDVMACIINGMTNLQEIANLLSIVRGVAEKHQGDIRRILRNHGSNIEVNIRKFIEQSDHHQSLRNHYAYLLRIATFEQTLRSIAYKRNSAQVSNKVLLYCVRDKDTKFLIDNSKRLDMRNHLQLAGYSVEVIDIRQTNLSDISNDIKENAKLVFVISQGFITEFNESKNIKTLLGHITGKIAAQDNMSPRSTDSILCSIRAPIPGNIVSTFPNSQQMTIKEDYCVSVLELLALLDSSISHDKHNINITDMIAAFKQNSSAALPTLNKVTSPLPHTASNRGAFFLSLYEWLSQVWHTRKSLQIELVVVLCFITIYTQYAGGTSIKTLSSISDAKNIDIIPKFAAVRSDLIIPSDAIFLNRPEIIKEIDSCFLNNSTNIQTVALIGIGGSGKTTLARQYAKMQKADIIWEINAENEGSIEYSLTNLAEALAQTPEDAKTWQAIQKIHYDNIERKHKLIAFVKALLGKHSNWVLIYDNVIDFPKIKQYYPMDSGTWGDGKVIITTQNRSLEDNIYVSKTVNVSDLTPEQQYILFLKSMRHSNKRVYARWSKYTKENILEFLEAIPSFPVDTLLTAVYLAQANTSFEEYLGLLKENNPHFAYAQRELLKDIGDYPKTRYAIIAASLEQIIKSNREFESMLFLVSFMDSPGIPKNLLTSYKELALVDSFLNNLHKYSLIRAQEGKEDGTKFSFYNGVQRMMLAFLRNNITVEQSIQYSNNAAIVFGNYINPYILNEERQELQILLPHARAFMDKVGDFSMAARGMIATKVCGISFALLHFIPELFIENLKKMQRILSQDHTKYDEYIAEIEYYLGRFYSRSRDMNEAIQHFNRSLQIYTASALTEHPYVPKIFVRIGYAQYKMGKYYEGKKNILKGIEIYKGCKEPNCDKSLWATLYLADIERRLGNYDTSTQILQQFLQGYSEKDPSLLSMSGLGYGELAKVARDKGDYVLAARLLSDATNDADRNVHNQWCNVNRMEVLRLQGNYRQALSGLSDTLQFYKEYAAEFIPWHAFYLGVLYETTGHYNASYKLLAAVYDKYSRSYGKDNINIAKVLIFLGKLYTDKGEYTQAESSLQQALNIYRKYLPESHIKIGFTLSLLGKNYILSKNHQKAKVLLHQSLLIYEQHYGNEHLETARVLASLGENALMQNKIKEAEDFLNRAYSVFKKAGHTDLYLILELLATLKLQKSFITKSETGFPQALKKEAIKHLNDALEIINERFPNPDDSMHSVRIKEKIGKILKPSGPTRLSQT